MARMLGRIESPGCCPGSRAGWTRLKQRGISGDCSGSDTDVRRRKAAERRAVEREAVAWMYPGTDLLHPLDDPSDCRHGCTGDCERWGSEVCTWLCHPADLTARVELWAEQTGHCDPAGDPDPSFVRAHLDRWARG